MSDKWKVRVKELLKRLLLMVPPLGVLALRVRAWLRVRLLSKQASQNRAKSYQILAEMLISQGALSEAADLYRRIIRHDPLLALRHRRKFADLCVQIGRIEDAMKQYELVLKESGETVDVVVQVAHVLAVNGYLDEAVRVYKNFAQAKSGASKLEDSGIRVLPYYWVDRIGHIAFLDSYFKMVCLGWYARARTVLLAPPDKVANHHYLSYWRPYFTEVISQPADIQALESLVRIPEDIYFAPYISPSGEATWWIKKARSAQQQWDQEGRPPLIRLLDEVVENGRQRLRQMGIPKDAWFVCLHTRDPAFHSSKPDPSQTWRDSDIDNYTLAIQAIADRGGWVVRMGDEQLKKAPMHDHLVDYANSRFKSDWMDVFLCAQCRFFIATNSGLGVVPSTFGVPAIAVDYIPLGNELYIKDGCFIPKLLWSEAEARYLTFHEAMTPPLGFTHSGDTFRGLQVRDNTPEEIGELVEEMLDRLDGRLEYSVVDEELQRRFNDLRKRHGIVSSAPIGRDFLRAFAALLDEPSSPLPPPLARESVGARLLNCLRTWLRR